MRREKVGPQLGREAGRDQRGGGGDEAVDDHGPAGGGRREHRASEDADLEPAHGREHADRIGGVRSMQRQRIADNRYLRSIAFVGDARPPPGDSLGG